MEVLSIQDGSLAEKIRRSTPDFQDLTEAKAFQAFGEDKSGSAKLSSCMRLELPQTGNMPSAAGLRP